MKSYREADGKYVISFARGETLRAPLETFCQSAGIQAAQISAIGALETPELGCYTLETQSYDRRSFEGIWELISCDGNISLLNGQPFLHAHVAISGHDFSVMGGHLFDSKVGVVVEMFLSPLATPLPRIPCASIGLPRWEPGPKH